MITHDVVITGIGLVSSLGEGTDVHWRKLTGGAVEPKLDPTRFAPYVIHPMPTVDWGLQIPKRGDQRQMETWQRLGTYTAGLALDDSGIKADEALCATMDMVIAAGYGERDETVDAAILEASVTRNDRDLLLNEQLTTELRPTLFLAQLSNLLAGNISIVHKVTGSSRSLMGEEGAGVSAIETAAARIRSGQSTHILVGGAYQTENYEMMLPYELGGYLHRGPWKPVWQRQGCEGGGVVTGCGSAFLVLESREHAEARGSTIYGRLGPVASSRSRRRQGKLAADIAELAARAGAGNEPLLVISGASGAHDATNTEKAMLDAFPAVAARGLATAVGHMKEAQFPFAVALAALAVRNGQAYPPFDPASEKPFDGAPRSVLATTIGYHQFEGMAMVSAA